MATPESFPPEPAAAYEQTRGEVERWCQEHAVDEKDKGWILGFLEHYRDATVRFAKSVLTLRTPRGRQLTYEPGH